MANLLDRFRKSLVGSDTKIADYLPIISPSGDFQRVENFEVILSSWNNILMTPRRTYTHDPEYGSNLYKLVFEQADDITRDKIRREVVDTINRYDPRAQIKKVKITYLLNNKGFTIDLHVFYKEGMEGQLSTTLNKDAYFNFLS